MKVTHVKGLADVVGPLPLPIVLSLITSLAKTSSTGWLETRARLLWGANIVLVVLDTLQVNECPLPSQLYND